MDALQQYIPPVSATDITKLPLAGGTMTGNLTMAAGTKIVGAAGDNIVLDSAAGTSGHLRTNNTIVGYWFSGGISTYNSYFSFLGSASNPSGSGPWINVDSSGNLNSNVATGSTHVAMVNGSRVGGFPLTPSDMPQPEFAQISKSSDQSLSGGTDNIITFGVNNAISNGSIHSTSSNTGRLVAILGGTYRCTITLQFDSNGVSNNYDYGIRKNGTTKVAVWRETFAISPSIRAVTAEFILTLAANDYIEWFVYPSSGGTYFVSGNTAGSGYFTAATFERIGA